MNDTRTIKAKADPSKTEYRQGSVEAETVLTGEESPRRPLFHRESPG